MKVPRTHQRKSKRIPKTVTSIASLQAAKPVYHFGSFSLNVRGQHWYEANIVWKLFGGNDARGREAFGICLAYTLRNITGP